MLQQLTPFSYISLLKILNIVSVLLLDFIIICYVPIPLGKFSFLNTLELAILK